ncbi:MAG TPA: DAK2 domain-containing protein [Pseudothermotoga sp.]|uniref:DAK2 domain-containing protein n=1 Tax=Thermotoga profunda TaxID=1508420 RepID=UPI001E4A2201|nr:DAK2 domain-containing protein [Thermotoga profunda]
MRILEKVNGKFMKLAFQKATEYLATHVDELNALNVFPVPDGDTGSNMLATMKEGCKYLDQLDKDKHELSAVMEAIRNGTLMGARGNSGVILSQIFRGFAMYCEKKKTLQPKDILKMFSTARNIAYKAVMRPVEGTMLTILRRIDERLDEVDQVGTVLEVLDWINKVAEETVKETPKLLPVLKEAGVVDAGAKGLYYILQGFRSVAMGEEKVNLEVVTSVNGEVSVELPIEELKYQYCTEVMVKGENDFHAEKVGELRLFLENIGDSAVVVHDGAVLKTHVHTNSPGIVIEEILKYGEILKVKVDNMKLQHEHLVEQIVEQPKRYGFVAVSPGHGISEVLRNLGVDQIVRGGQTMNPSTADLKFAIDRVKAEIIFLFPNNPNIILAAKQAAENTKDKQVIIIPTQTVQECISAMMSFDPNEEPDKLQEKFVQAANYIISLCITRAVRDAKHNGTKIKKGEYMVMRGKKLVSHGQSLKQAMIRALTALDLRGREIVTIFTGQDAIDTEIDMIKEALEKAVDQVQIDIHEGGQPHYPYLLMIE